jgi:putative addiction module component (TIGR02574 family)
MQNSLLAEINNLSVTERILLVEDIWEHLAGSDDAKLGLSDVQRTELDRRITAYKDQPDVGRYWNDLREEYLSGKQ